MEYNGNRKKRRLRLQRRIQITFPMMERGECKIEGRTVRFRPGEYEVLLILLLGHPDRYLTVWQIVELAWPNADLQPDAATDIVQKYISDMRAYAAPIETRWGYGYRIPPECRSLYTARRVISVANPNCVSPRSSRNNRKGMAGDYRNKRA